MDLHTKNIRIFSQVMRDGSFSKAARSLKITQPTVSQQILRLEADLGVTLFERAGHDIIPTAAAKEFYEYAQSIVEQTDAFADFFSSRQAQPHGLVRYAMPESCQWTPHFKKIMGQLRETPEMQFEIDITSNPKIVEGLLTGSYDFGFIAGEKLTPELRYEKFSDEVYICVAQTEDLFEPLKKKQKQNCRFISYDGWEIFLRAWLKAQGLTTAFENEMRTPPVKIGTLVGAIHAVKEGAGVAVVPAHCVSEELKNGLLVEYKGKPNRASHPIYLCRKVGSKKPVRVEYVIDVLKKAKMG